MLFARDMSIALIDTDVAEQIAFELLDDALVDMPKIAASWGVPIDAVRRIKEARHLQLTDKTRQQLIKKFTLAETEERMLATDEEWRKEVLSTLQTIASGIQMLLKKEPNVGIENTKRLPVPVQQKSVERAPRNHRDLPRGVSQRGDKFLISYMQDGVQVRKQTRATTAEEAFQILVEEKKKLGLVKDSQKQLFDIPAGGMDALLARAEKICNAYADDPNHEEPVYQKHLTAYMLDKDASLEPLINDRRFGMQPLRSRLLGTKGRYTQIGNSPVWKFAIRSKTKFVSPQEKRKQTIWLAAEFCFKQQLAYFRKERAMEVIRKMTPDVAAQFDSNSNYWREAIDELMDEGLLDYHPDGDLRDKLYCRGSR